MAGRPGQGPYDQRGSLAYHERARRTLPRGVASALRADQRPTPLAFASSAGSRLVDVDGNEYVDYVGAYGPAFLGHRPPAVLAAVARQLEAGVLFGGQHDVEARLAERIVEAVPSAEQVLLCSSGSEAVQVALRVARARTGRDLVVKFEGHYHGWSDQAAINPPGVPAAPPDALPPLPQIPAGPGQWPDVGTLVCRWNDLGEVRALLDAHRDCVAAVIMEPVACNFGNYEAHPGYLQGVRDLCDAHGALLVYDEVITGFRMALGGAQERYGVEPHLTVLAKAMASGFPLGAVVGGRDAMEPASTSLRHMGTYNGNSVTAAAALATIEQLTAERAELYPRVERLAVELARGLCAAAAEAGFPLLVNQVGPVLQLYVSTTPVTTYAEAMDTDRERLAELAGELTLHGVHGMARAMWFVGATHGPEDIELTVAAAGRAFARLGAPAGQPA